MTTINNVGNGLSGSTGSGTFVGANTPTLITPVLGAATGTSLVTSGSITAGLGAGGSPGTLISFPTTTSKGRLVIAAVDNATGAFDTTISNATAVGQTQAVTIPDSGASTAKFILSTGAGQTIGNGLTLTTPVLGVASATSINFGGSTLNTYVQNGTWTPTITYSTPGDLSVVYTTQVGQYTRIGNIVTMSFSLAFTPTFTTASGFLKISFPITTNATTGVYAFGNCLFQSSTFPTGTTSLFLQGLNNSTTFLVGANGSAVAANYMSTTQTLSTVAVVIQGSITYLV